MLCLQGQQLPAVGEEELTASQNTGAQNTGCSCSLPSTGIQETKEIHPGLGLGPEGRYFFPFPKGSYVLWSHVISFLAQGR